VKLDRKLTGAVEALNIRRRGGRISMDEPAFDDFMDVVHERAFDDGWHAGKQFLLRQGGGAEPSGRSRHGLVRLPSQA
jgi:hypothetical protein